MYIGIDLGGTNIAVGLVDNNGKIIKKGSTPTLKNRGYEAVVSDMAGLTKRIISEAGYSLDKISSIGIGSPGTPEPEKGLILFAGNLDFVNVPIRQEIQKYIDLPVYIENDANCAALAESTAGAAKGTAHSVTITLGTGVGCGMIVNNKIYSGFNNAASEMGHCVIVVDGEPCTCGRKGCWEAYASASALKRQTVEAAKNDPSSLLNTMVQDDIEKISAKTAFDAAKKGDETARKVIDNYIKYVAEGIVNVINIFEPEVIAIGGGISAQGEYLLKPMREYAYKYIFCKEAPRTQIKAAEMGNDAGIVGAAMLGKG